MLPEGAAPVFGVCLCAAAPGVRSIASAYVTLCVCLCFRVCHVLLCLSAHGAKPVVKCKAEANEPETSSH